MRRPCKTIVAVIVLSGLVLGYSPARAADPIWQWSTPVNSSRKGYGPSVAYLWIPPSCSRVRGILIAQNNMEEISIFENPIMRESLAQEGFAEIYVSPVYNLFFDFSQGPGACPGEGHFASTDDKVRFLALYIGKAIHYRLPSDVSAGQAPHLQAIDSTKSGWLADRWRGINALPTAEPAPVATYQGDPKQAFWYFDEETAKAAVAVGAKHHGKKTQLVGIMQDGQLLPQTTLHLQLFPKWEPLADGITFKLSGGLLRRGSGPLERPSRGMGRRAAGSTHRTCTRGRTRFNRHRGRPVRKNRS